MSRYDVADIMTGVLGVGGLLSLALPLPWPGLMLALLSIFGQVVLAIAVCVLMDDRPRKTRAHKKKPEPPEIDDLPLIPPAAVRPGDKNEYGEYIFDPSWSANRFWLMGCKITSFEYRNYERW